MIAARARSTAPPERLWLVVAATTQWPDHLMTFTSVTREGGEGPLERGARYRVRQPGLPAATYEVTECEPGRTFTWVARSPGVTTTAVHTVGEAPGGATLELTLDWTGPLAGLVRAVLGRRTQQMVLLEAQTFAGVAGG